MTLDPLYAGASAPPEAATLHDLAGIKLSVLVTDTDPTSAPAQWMADREVALLLPDDIELDDLRRVLPEFLAYARELADRPTDAVVTLASRDVDRCRIVRDAGFVSGGVLAVQDLRSSPGPGAGSPPAGLTVRDAADEDGDTVAALWWEQAEYEARVGPLRVTPAIRSAIRTHTAELLAGETSVLLAEVDGTAVGAIVAQSPTESAWVATKVAAAPVSYLAMASTSTRRRGSGVGGSLVAELHRRHRAAGVAISALHYSTFNPLSVPFWSQQGYRPLLSIMTAHVGEQH